MPDERDELLSIVEDAGLSAEPAHEDFHYVAYPLPGEELRVDFLFPYSTPDITAVSFPVQREFEGLNVPVWPAEHLAAAKLVAYRHKDRLDLLEMADRGIFDVDKTYELLKQDNHHEGIANLRSIQEALRPHRAPGLKRTRKRDRS